MLLNNDTSKWELDDGGIGSDVDAIVGDNVRSGISNGGCEESVGVVDGGDTGCGSVGVVDGGDAGCGSVGVVDGGSTGVSNGG